MYTKKIEGSDTTASGQYSDGMAQAILLGLQQEAKRRNPQRFHKQTTSIGSSSTAMRHSHASQTDAHSHGQASEHSEQHQVYYAHPSHDTTAWAHVLDELETRFTNTYKRPFNIGESDELFTHIQQLVPWQLSRAQAVWTPAARRLPLDIPYTHRGCAYKNTQGQIALEHEDLSAVAYPKQRFAEAIRVALFFFGIPPEEEPPPEEHPEAELHEALPHTPATTSTRRVQGLETDIYFDGGPPLTQQQRTSIARLHCNLGHPPKAEIVRILAAAGKLDSKILSALDALRCGSCTRMTKTVKPPPSSTSTTKFSGAFGDHLQSDIIYIRLLTGEAIPTIGIVCMSTNYHAAKTLQDRSPDHVLDVMHEIWYRPFGLPLSITLDSDGAYLASNQAWHQHLGIEHNVIPAEESWRLGKIGRRNALMRTLAERLIDQTGAVTRHDLDLILTAVLNSMNTSTYTYGRSPCQAVFGRIPRPIGDILSDQTALSISPQLHPEQQGLQPELLRAEALTALAQFSASQSIRRALLRKTRNQGDPTSLEPGQTIAYWRQQGRSRQHKKGAWNLARFLALDPDRKSAWVQVGKHSLKIGVTQIRPAAGWENWVPSQEDLETIRQAEHNISNHLWGDDTGEAPAEGTALPEDEIFQFQPTKQPRLEHQARQYDEDMPEPEAAPFFQAQPTAEPYSLATLPPPIDHGQASAATASVETNIHQQQQMNMRQTNTQQTVNVHQDRRKITVNIDSPTYQRYGPEPSFGPTPPTPRSMRGRTRASPGTPTAPYPPVGQEQRPAPSTPVPVLTDVDTAPTGHATEQAATSALPSGDSAPNTYLNRWVQQFITYDDGTAAPREPHWDGSPDYNSTSRPCNQFYQAYLNSSKRKQELAEQGITHKPNQSDTETSDDDLTQSNQRQLTRQELKQLDRELPWREIMAMPWPAIEKFIESAYTEYEGWMNWSTIRPLTKDEVKQVLSDPVLKRRILRSRAAYKDKSRGIGELRAKTRVVLIGCADPDLRQLTRDSPTPTRLSETIIMAIAASGANRLFQGDGKSWSLWLSDAEKAFLQGEQDSSERYDLPLFMEPPNDPIIKASGAYSAELYQITGNCYGLSNAPRVWYKKVDRTVKEADFEQHTFDRCFYYHHGDDGLLDCLMIVHVDDFMAVYAETFNLDILRNLFSWGSVTLVSSEKPGTYRGKEISLHQVNGKWHYQVTQRDFIQTMHVGKLAKGRLQGDPQLTTDEVKEYRSICGSLQWLGGQTRPDVCATTSLTHRGGAAQIQDLHKLYQVMEHVKESKDQGLIFAGIPLNLASVIVTLTDSSWANAEKHKSQYGLLVTLCPPQVTQVTCGAVLLDWKSGRSPRVCRSTLAAEACAADEGRDRASFVNYFLTELLHGIPSYEGRAMLSSMLCVDAKSLYDCLIQENPSVSEKRLMVELRSSPKKFNHLDQRRIRSEQGRMKFYVFLFFCIFSHFLISFPHF